MAGLGRLKANLDRRSSHATSPARRKSKLPTCICLALARAANLEYMWSSLPLANIQADKASFDPEVAYAERVIALPNNESIARPPKVDK